MGVYQRSALAQEQRRAMELRARLVEKAAVGTGKNIVPLLRVGGNQE